jgi:uncharacterized protein
MAHYLLTYTLASDYLERRAAFRTEHLRLAWQASERGELLLGGALAEPTDRALLLFAGDGPAAASAFAQADPYVRNGLVTAGRCSRGPAWSARWRRTRSVRRDRRARRRATCHGAGWRSACGWIVTTLTSWRVQALSSQRPATQTAPPASATPCWFTSSAS